MGSVILLFAVTTTGFYDGDKLSKLVKATVYVVGEGGVSLPFPLPPPPQATKNEANKRSNTTDNTFFITNTSSVRKHLKPHPQIT